MKVEGRNAVRELLTSSKPIDKILMQQNKDSVLLQIEKLALSSGVRVQTVPTDVLNRESVTHRHQGVIATTSEFVYCDTLDIIAEAERKGEDVFIVILDGIEDPHNFGSIIRVCECLGVHGIIIGKNRACSVNETVIRVSAGAINHMKIARVTNINQEIEMLKSKGIWIYACELGGENLAQSKLTGKVGIVIGSEGKGVSTLTRKVCDGVVTIPMKGKVNSLNASVATGIVLWEVSKQR